MYLPSISLTTLLIEIEMEDLTKIPTPLLFDAKLLVLLLDPELNGPNMVKRAPGIFAT